MSQNQQVLKHLKKHGKISSMTAFTKYGITRLASRVFDLKTQGHKINTTLTTKNKKTFGVYTLY